LFGRVTKCKYKFQHIQFSETTSNSKGTGFYGQIKLKKVFLPANTQDGLGANRDKKYPMSTVKYTARSLMLLAYVFLLEVLDILFRYMVSWILANTNRLNQNLTPTARNRIIGRGWIVHQDNNPKQTSKSTEKCVTENKMKLLP